MNARRTRRYRIWIPVVGVAMLTLGLAGCEGSGSNASANTKNPNNPELFTIPPEQMSHVQVVKVEPTTLTRSLRLTGAVAYNAFHTTPVLSQISGPVSRIAVVPGEHVHQGQAMLFVASPDYSQLRTNYLKAKDAYALAQKAYARAKDLYEHKAIAEQALEQAQSAEAQAGGDLAAAQAALKVLGITDPDALVQAPPSFEVPVKAPISGEVVEQDVAAGQLIQPSATQCFMISDMSSVWVLVNVYQKDLPYVRVGDSVSIQTDSYPEVFHGRIAYVAASLDPNTRTLQARIDTSNPGEKLKKDMYVTATVNAGTIKNAIALPDCRDPPRQRKSAFRLRRDIFQSVRQAPGDNRGEPERTNGSHKRAESGRPGHWRRKSFPAICKFSAALDDAKMYQL